VNHFLKIIIPTHCLIRERKAQKEREDNWKLLRQKVEKMSIKNHETAYMQQEQEPKNELFPTFMSKYHN
jgi:hypothetical protein